MKHNTNNYSTPETRRMAAQPVVNATRSTHHFFHEELPKETLIIVPRMNVRF